MYPKQIMLRGYDYYIIDYVLELKKGPPLQVLQSYDLPKFKERDRGDRNDRVE